VTAHAVTSPDVVWQLSAVSRSARWAATGAAGATVWLTGLSGSGKSTVGIELERRLVSQGRPAYLLDGDNLRHGLNADLGFSAADRDENVRRAAEVARLFADAGMVAIVPLISPYRAPRQRARELHLAAGLPFVEVFVDTPLALCERRDPKGLYARARRGELTGMTGIDDPYEPPDRPELRWTPADGSPTVAAERILDALADQHHDPQLTSQPINPRKMEET
jgi:adenylyl-sulfate kinase